MAHSETMELLVSTGRLLSSKLDLGDLLRTVLGFASRVVDAESASLLLVDENTGELYFDVALGLGDEASRFRLKMGQGIAGAVAKERKPAVINDVRAEPRWSPAMDEATGFVTRSILAVPMTIKGRLIGVLEAINKKKGGFTLEDLAAFEAFASQASVAIDNARLFSSLNEEKIKLDAVFSEMSDSAVLADGSGRILLANAAARKLMGVGTEPVSLFAAMGSLAFTPSLREIMTSQAPWTDFAAAREQPKKLVLVGRATRLSLATEGKALGSRELPETGWLWVFRDDTDEWMKERLKRTFLSLISHKLKTPLASVTGYAEILLSDYENQPPPEDHVKAVQSILSQGQKLADLVERLLRYTTLENPEAAGEPVPCTVDDLMHETLAVMRRWLSDHEAKVDYSPAPGLTVVGDREQLGEVLRNVIENAVKFDQSPEKTVKVRAHAQDGMACVEVSDRGPGIPPEDQDRIFSQFHQIEASFTGQMDGWGLGMPFVKKIVERHGGKVEIRSELGRGTTVSVLLPARGGAGPGGA